MPRSYHLVLFLICFSFQSALGAKTSPSDVFQRTEVLRVTLQGSGMLDEEKYKENEGKNSHILHHPRHVMQKVRECHTLISKLLKQENLDAVPLPDLFSMREVRPSDVLNGVNHLIQEVQKIAPLRQADKIKIQNKVPHDVYNNLTRICSSIHVKIIPSDVYQVAQAVNLNLDKILIARGYEYTPPYQTYMDKKPADVYEKTSEFLIVLRTLALNSDFAIPGGVIIPSKVPEAEIQPHDVIVLMNYALAETSAIKYSLGVREYSILPPYEEKKTPSDVYAQIDRAHNIVKFLVNRENNDEL